MSVSLVSRAHGHGRVPQEGLRPSGRDGNSPATVFIEVPDVVQVGIPILVLHLQVREGGGTTGTPVHDTFRSVNKSFPVQVHEGRAYGATGPFIEGEVCAALVAGGAKALYLLVYRATILVDPFPYLLNKLLPAQVVTGQPVFRQLSLHNHVRRYASVVRTRKVQGRFTLHPVPARHKVF